MTTMTAMTTQRGIAPFNSLKTYVEEIPVGCNLFLRSIQNFAGTIQLKH